MAAHRYWRLIGFELDTNSPLELSEARLYAAGALADTTATVTSSLPPASGVLADLRDGLTTGVVVWTYAQRKQSGFFLAWDFGAAVDVDGLRLGSGASANTCPRGVTAQWSDDGQSWVTLSITLAIKYPGAFSMTAPVTSTDVDDFASSVTLKLQCDGANNSITFQDGSPLPIPVTPLNGARISNAVVRNDGAALLLESGGVLSVAHAPGLNLVEGDFTVELWVYKTDSRAVFILDKDGAAGSAYAQWSLLCVGGKLQFRIGTASLVGFQTGTCATDVPLNQWSHLAFTRSGTTLRLFVGGVLDGAGTFTQSVSMVDGGRPLLIGNSSGQADWFGGYMDDIRVTKGVARYTASFTPPARLGASPQFVETDASSLKSKWQSSSVGTDAFSGASLPDGAAGGHLKPVPFFDVYNGGIGLVYGTVKEQSSPANTPLRRRMLLIDERSRVTIRQTWSDAVTGNYEFRGVKEGVTYSVLSYDHTGAFRAVVADGQIPELIA